MADIITDINSTSSLVMHHLNGYEVMDEFARKWIKMWEDTYFEPIKFTSLSIKHNGTTFQSGATVKAGDVFTITWNLSKAPYQDQTKLSLANNNFAFTQAEIRKYTLDIEKLSTASPTILSTIPFTSNGVTYSIMQKTETALIYWTASGASIEVCNFTTKTWKDKAYAVIQVSAEDFYKAPAGEQAWFAQYINADIPNDPNGRIAVVPSVKGSNTYSFKWVGADQIWITSQTLGSLTAIDPQKTNNIVTTPILLIPGNSGPVIPGGGGEEPGGGGGSSITYIDILVVASPSSTDIPVISNGKVSSPGGARVLYTDAKPSNAFPTIKITITKFADNDNEDDYIWVKLPIDKFDTDIQERMNIDNIIYLFNPTFPAPMTAVGTEGWCVSENSFNSNPDNADNDRESIEKMVFQIRE